jgi:peptide chain release factor 2
MVKDHRTGEESGNAQAVLDGKIDNFMSAYLKWKKTGVKSGDDSQLD